MMGVAAGKDKETAGSIPMSNTLTIVCTPSQHDHAMMVVCFKYRNMMWLVLEC